MKGVPAFFCLKTRRTNNGRWKVQQIFFLDKTMSIDQIRVEGIRLLSCWVHEVRGKPGRTRVRFPVSEKGG